MEKRPFELFLIKPRVIMTKCVLATQRRLIEDVISISGIPQGGRILEVGCGTGQATIPFAKRGYSMLCLDIGEALAARARENCRQYPNVQIQNVSFEEWDPRGNSFKSRDFCDGIPLDTSRNWLLQSCASVRRFRIHSHFLKTFTRPHTSTFSRPYKQCIRRLYPNGKIPVTAYQQQRRLIDSRRHQSNRSV